MNDDLGDRMKGYEVAETSRRLDPHKPIYARIDGRSFSRFTRGMERPFDLRMTSAMIETTRYLVDETHARLGYTQSDEISLVWKADGETGDIFFSGKVQKMCSVLASMAAAKFARICPEGFEDRLPHFDCRVFQLPSDDEAANAFLWRANDARKNSIQMVAQANFSPKQLHGKSQTEQLEMIASLGIDFEAYPEAFKDGTFLRRKTAERLLTADELDHIPEKHRPTGPIIRHSIEIIPTGPFRYVEDRAQFVMTSPLA